MHTTEITPWYKRRWLAIPVGVWATLAAGVALAALIIAVSTGPDTFTTQATGTQIDMFGDEGQQLFSDPTLAVGDSLTSCLGLRQPMPASGEFYAQKMYANGYSAGGAEDAIELTVVQYDPPSNDNISGFEGITQGQTPGGCDPAKPGQTVTTLFTGTLADFSAYTAWMDGLETKATTQSFGNPYDSFVYEFTITIPEANADLANALDTAVLGFSFEGRDNP